MDGYHALPSTLPSSGASGEGDVELANLAHVPDDSTPPPDTGHMPDSDEEDHDVEDGDQSDYALLGSRERTRGRERQPADAARTWPQIRTIVLEVSSSCCVSSFGFWVQKSRLSQQTGPTLLFTAVSMLFTGKLLERVSVRLNSSFLTVLGTDWFFDQQWRAMRQVDELIIIIPVILNLKGNLEMNLSARLGTAANVGELDKVDVQRSVIYGNLLLLQVQATVVSFVATCVSFIIGLAVPDPVQSTRPDARGTITSTTHPLLRGLYPGHRRAPYIPVKGKDGTQKSGVRGYVSLLFYGDLILLDPSRFLMVASTSMTAACLSSLFLGSLMCCIVLLCRRFGRDPGRLCTPPPIPPSDQIILFPRHADNIAPPIASCLGDLITLSFVGLVSTLLIPVINTPIPSVLGVVVILSAVACLTFTLRNPLVRHLLREGWSPLFGAMAIEVATGIVLDLFVHRYEGFAILAVAISSALSKLESWTFISILLTASLLQASRATSVQSWCHDYRQLFTLQLCLSRSPEARRNPA